MKVLAAIPAKSWDDKHKYICEITADEIAAVMDKAGYNQIDEFKKLSAGQDFPLQDGYNFRNQIAKAMNNMTEAHKSFAKSTEIMKRFIEVTSLEEEVE
jgi:hypothetical protein